MKTARQLTLAILIITAISAFIGGYILLADTSGHSLQLSLDDLKGSPFKDYAVPAWVLILFIGVTGIVAAITTAKQLGKYTSLVMLEGIMLLVFIIVQIILIQELKVTQIVFGLFGFALILLGSLIRKNQVGLVHHNPQQQIHHSLAKAHKKSHYHKHRKRGSN
jgi:hypothetical protein